MGQLLSRAPVQVSQNSGRPLRQSMFAITCDMDTTDLQDADHDIAWQNAYSAIGKVLALDGFARQLGSVSLGDDTVDAVRCVLAVQALSREYVWFTPSVRDIRMLRIEDNNDLMPAVQSVRP